MRQPGVEPATSRSQVQRPTIRPVESRSGARETIIAGPYHNLILMRRDRDTQCVEREETWGGVSPHHPTMGLGKRKLTQGVRGGAPAEN